MGYKIVSQPRAWWPIRFNGVSEDGKTIENVIEGRFIILDEDEFKQFEDDMRPVLFGDDGASQKLSELLAPFILRILEDWKDVLEDDGTEAGKSLPFSADNLKRMLRVPNFATAVATACREVRTGEPERRKGN